MNPNYLDFLNEIIEHHFKYNSICWIEGTYTYKISADAFMISILIELLPSDIPNPMLSLRVWEWARGDDYRVQYYLESYDMWSTQETHAVFRETPGSVHGK